MKLLMFMWNLSDIDRFIPRIKALATQGIKFIVAYNSWNPKTLLEYRKIVNTHSMYFNKLPSYGKWLWSRKMILRQVQNIEFDAVFSLSGIWFQYYSEYIAEKMSKPYVLFLRGDGFKSPEFQKRGNLKIAIRKYIYKNYGWNPDLCIPITCDLIQLALDMNIHPSKITSPIGGGIDTEMFKPMKRPSILIESEHIFTVGYAGRISKEKGSELLQLVVDMTPDVRYLMAGKIQDRDFKVRKNVIHIGEIPHSKMPSFYNDCDVLLMTSKIEGFPRVLLEAYACGKPVIVTPNSVPSDCKIYGVMTKENALSITKWVDIYSRRYGDIKITGVSARLYAETFSLESYAKEMKESLESIINQYQDF